MQPFSLKKYDFIGFCLAFYNSLEVKFPKLELQLNNKDVALLSRIVIALQNSSFVFVWLCIVFRCWLLLSLLFG